MKPINVAELKRQKLNEFRQAYQRAKVEGTLKLIVAKRDK